MNNLQFCFNGAFSLVVIAIGGIYTFWPGKVREFYLSRINRRKESALTNRRKAALTSKWYILKTRITGVMILMVGLLVGFIIFHSRCNKSMDISEIVGKQEDLEDFIHHYFDGVEYDRVLSPILLYHVNFINKTDHLRFCKMNIQQCWVKKVNDLYAFFMVIKTSAEIEKHISVRYGKWDTKSSISIQDSPLGGDLITWNKGDINIDVSSYQNTFRIRKYEACDLVICGNMTSHQLLDLPEK